MAKKILTVIKLEINAGQANPAPPVGTALGPHGINIMDFCKAYNEKTKDQTGTIIPAEITIYEDRSFSFVTKKPPAAILLKEAVKIEKGSKEPNRDKVAQITKAKVREVAEAKIEDLNASDIESAMKVIEGTARSMGIEVVE